MKKTITIQSYNRPNHLRKCLDHLSNLDCVGNWTVYGIVDGGGDPECKEVMLDSDLIQYSKFHTMNLGIRKANKKTLEYIFEEVGSDLSLHVEEDVLLAQDSLKLINQVERSVDNNIFSLSLYSYPQLNQQSDKVHKFKGFSCWGWCASKRFYDVVIDKALNNDRLYYQDSWATSVYDYVQELGIYQYIPEMSHAKNIGIEDGTHAGTDNNRLDINDHWVGGRFQSVEDYDICGERCQTCRSMDGVR